MAPALLLERKRMITPPIGYPVQFFPFADRHSPPVAAIVSHASSGGHIKLNLLRQGGGEMVSSGEFVRHIDDPWVSENGHVLRMARHGVERGAWDWVPGLEISKAVDDAATSRKRDEGLKRVIEGAEAGKSVDSIARSVRTYGISKDEVEQLLKTEAAV